jgi:anti-sigma regulatory factor (Ser/Thr protein kinase)
MSVYEVVSVAHAGHKSDELAELRLPAREESIPRAREEVRRFVSSRGWSSADIELAVTEAVANSLEHGYRGSDEGTIVVRLETLVPETLLVTVSDDGVGIEPHFDAPGLGYGLALIGRLSRGFEITRREPGTEVRMTFALTPL